MPIRKWSRPYIRALAAEAAGKIQKVIILGGFKYGNYGKVVGSSGIASANPRTPRTDILLKSPMNWRGLSATVPQLGKTGTLGSSTDRGQESDFEWTPPVATLKTEDLIGDLPQVDVTIAEVIEDTPTTVDHGLSCDSCFIASSSSNNGFAQFVDVGGSVSLEVWTLSVYVAPVDPGDTANKSVYLAIGNNTSTDFSSTIATYSGKGKWQRLAFTKTFLVGTTSTSILVRLAPISPSGWAGGMLVAAAQLEQNAPSGVPRAYERTSYTVQGTYNEILGSHFPTRRSDGAAITNYPPNPSPATEWVMIGTAGVSMGVDTDAGRGPEIRAIVPTAGTAEFGAGYTGPSFPNGQLLLKPYDWWGATLAQRLRVTTADAAIDRCVYQLISGQTLSGKTLIASVWLRKAAASTGYVVPATGVWLNAESWTGGGYTSNTSVLIPPSQLTYAWRRYWITHKPAGGDEFRFKVHIAHPSTVGEAIEVWGCQAEIQSAVQIPKDYTPTTSSAGAITDNALKYSSAINTSPWALESGLTIDAAVGSPPIEFYQAYHPSFGTAPSTGLIRLNRGGASYPSRWSFQVGGVGNDDISGAMYSIGSYGAEKLGVLGEMNFNYEHVTNGDFETGAFSPWLSATAGNTVPANAHVIVSGQGDSGSGKYAVKSTRNQASGSLYIYQGLYNFVSAKWYRFSARVKGTPGLTARLNVSNPSTGFLYQAASDTWAASGGLADAAQTLVVTGSYQTIERWVLMDTLLTTQEIRWWAVYNDTTNGSLYWDDVSVDGPYDLAGDAVTHVPSLAGWTATVNQEHLLDPACESLTNWTSYALWQGPSHYYAPGSAVTNAAGNRYVTTAGGTSGSTAPTGTGTVSDGVVSWVYKGSVTLSTTTPHQGTYCFAFLHVGSYSLGVEQYTLRLLPGAWYKWTLWIKGSTTKTAGIFLRLVNLTQQRQWSLSSGGWIAGNSGAVPASQSDVTTSWTQVDFWFQAEADAPITDSYAPVIGSATAWANGDILYVDDMTLVGPYRSAYGDDFDVFTPSTGSEAFADDEEASDIVQACKFPLYRYQSGITQLYPQMYVRNTASISFSAGWHTIRVRVARHSTTTQVRMAIRQAGGSQFFLDTDHVTFRSATMTWLDPHLREGGVNAPDFGVAVWHVYFPSSGSKYLYFGGFTSSTAMGQELIIDSIRVWDAAGALYSCADRTETQGTPACLYQGLETQMRGVIDGAVDGDDTKLRVRVRDYPHGAGIEVPGRTAQTNCPLPFRGPECGYINNTTITVDESGALTSYHTCGSTSGLVQGRYIRDWTGTGFCTIGTIPDTTHFYTVEPQKFPSGALVTYSECKRTYGDCVLRGTTARGNTHRYAGFRATKAWEAVAGTPYYKTVGYGWLAQYADHGARTAAELIGAITMAGQDHLNEKKIFDDAPIAVIYGRKSLKLQPIETHFTKFATDATIYSNTEWLTTFFAIGMGEIDSVRSFFTDDGFINHDPTNGVAIHWHPGFIGEDDRWKQSDQVAVMATQKVNNQKRDFRTNTDTAYSRVAYAILQLKKSDTRVTQGDPESFLQLWADIKGKKVQKYDAKGRTVGSPVWSRNPIWQFIDLLLDTVYGAGLSRELIDWETMYRSALVCDETITSSEAQTKTLSYADSTVHDVVSVAGFAPEMPCLVNQVANKVINVDPINQRLFFETTVSTLPTNKFTVVGTPARYTCDLVMNKKGGLSAAFDDILGSCRGYIVYDGGKLGVEVELAAGDSRATVWTVGTPTPSDKMGVIDGTVKYNQRPMAAQAFNMLEATYECASLIAGTIRTAKFADADRGGLDFPRVLKIEAPGCDTGDQALRVSLPKLAKACGASATLADSEQDSRGFSVESGISLKRAKPGDFMIVTRLNRTTSKPARIRSLAVNEKGLVKAETIPEARKLRPDGFMTAIDPWGDAPSRETAYGSPLRPQGLALSVASFSARVLEVLVSSSGYAVGPGDNSGSHVQSLAAIEVHVSLTPGFTPTIGQIGMGGTLAFVMNPGSSFYTWQVPNDYLEVNLYVRACGIQGTGTGASTIVVQSTEVGPIKVYLTDRPTSDPTQQQGSDPTNMVHGGDFEPGSGWDETTGNASPGYGGYLSGNNKFADPLVATSYEGPASPSQPAQYWPPNSTLRYVQTMRNAGSTRDVLYTDLSWMSDGSDSTYFQHMNQYQNTAGVANSIGQFILRNFGVSSPLRTGRVWVRYTRPTNASTELGQVRTYYSADATIATPVWADLIGASYVGPSPTTIPYVWYSADIFNVNLATMGILVSTELTYTSTPGGHAVWLQIQGCGFEEKSTASTVGSVNSNLLSIHGNGTLYGGVRRPFPGNSPPVEANVVFNAGTLNQCRIMLRYQNAGDVGADALPVEIRLFDGENEAAGWTIASIPGDVITANWIDYAIKFSSASAISGSALKVQVRTANTKTILCDKLLIARGDTLFRWAASPQNQAAGYFGEYTNGESQGFEQGSWVVETVDGSVTRYAAKKSTVS